MKRKRLASFGSALALSLSSLVSTHPLQAFLAITGLAAAIALIARSYSRVLAR